MNIKTLSLIFVVALVLSTVFAYKAGQSSVTQHFDDETTCYFLGVAILSTEFVSEFGEVFGAEEIELSQKMRLGSIYCDEYYPEYMK